jgi:hypothetical protein
MAAEIIRRVVTAAIAASHSQNHILSSETLEVFFRAALLVPFDPSLLT